MKVLKTVVVTGIVVAAVVVLALEPASGAGTEWNAAPCSKAMIGDAGWQGESLAAGPVAVPKDAVRRMSRTPKGELVGEVPLLVTGRTAVTVSVPPDLRKRVHLYYGRTQGRDETPTTSFAESGGYGETEFQPCPDRASTAWSGGLRIVGSAPVRLLVHTGGGAEPVPLGLGRPKADEKQKPPAAG